MVEQGICLVETDWEAEKDKTGGARDKKPYKGILPMNYEPPPFEFPPPPNKHPPGL